MHTSVYKAYVFCEHHCLDIIEFFTQEQKTKASIPDSLRKVVEVCSSAANVEEIQPDLKEYLQAMTPLADYLNAISEPRKLSHQIDQLEQQLLDIWDHAVHNYFEEEENLPIAVRLAFSLRKQFTEYNPDGTQNEIMMQLQYLHPANVALGDPELGEKFVKRLNFTTTDSESVGRLIAAEWDLYTSADDMAWNLTLEDQQHPLHFWERDDVSKKYPNLAPLAIFLLSMPVVVTGCDGTISMEGHLLRCRQSRLQPAFAGRLVAARVNMVQEANYEST